MVAASTDVRIRTLVPSGSRGACGGDAVSTEATRAGLRAWGTSALPFLGTVVLQASWPMSSDTTSTRVREPGDIAVTEDWLTPTGQQRTVPMYEAVIANSFLGERRTVKGKSRHDVVRKAWQQVQAWNSLEKRQRNRSAAETQDERAKEALRAVAGILAASLAVDDRLDWTAMYDHRPFEEFTFGAAPAPLVVAKKPWWLFLLFFLMPRWERQQAAIGQAKRHELARWDAQRTQAFQLHQQKRAAYDRKVKRHNASVAAAKARYESGDATAVVEYLGAVFERSVYPQSFFVEHSVLFDAASRTAVVELELPRQSDIPSASGFKLIASRQEIVPVYMKPKDHDQFYDAALKQAVLRTMHEVFESDYVANALACVVNGFVTDADPATGMERRTCVVSVEADRASFMAMDLARVDPSACIARYKGLIAGPLSQVAPVRPIMVLSRHDARFVDSRDVLAEIGEQNLASMEWQDFEQLVRELFAKMFTTEGAEVRITQASRDQGVDAVAFDPDPIRGGKFVIQAKRYTKVVPVSAVRDLYGTLINEGAVKGVLVTTAHYGRDSRAFAKDKPITLIDGPQLVWLLEQHGHRVRLDVEGARPKSTR
jgi:restriction system protein